MLPVKIPFLGEVGTVINFGLVTWGLAPNDPIWGPVVLFSAEVSTLGREGPSKAPGLHSCLEGKPVQILVDSLE